MRKAFEKEGYGIARLRQGAASDLSDELMTIRFTAKTIEKLCDMLRAPGRRRAPATSASCARIIVDKCGMPQEHFIKDFPPNLLNLKWVEKRGRGRQARTASMLARNMPADPGTAAEADRPAGARGRAARRT